METAQVEVFAQAMGRVTLVGEGAVVTDGEAIDADGLADLLVSLGGKVRNGTDD